MAGVWTRVHPSRCARVRSAQDTASDMLAFEVTHSKWGCQSCRAAVLQICREDAVDGRVLAVLVGEGEPAGHIVNEGDP